MIGYGRHTETERVLVDNEELITLNRLKIQSFLLGNPEGGCIYVYDIIFNIKFEKSLCIYAAKSLMEMK
jgi:hypothetical protein